MFPWDTYLFLLVNHAPHTWVLDHIALFLSGVGKVGIVWFVIAVWMFLREEKRDHWFFAPFFLSAGATGFLAEWLLKMLIARPRPTLEMGAIIVAATDNHSFPSTHTTLAFAMAYVLSAEEPRFRIWFYVLATLIAVSRIYLGVHYPIDVIAGILLGLGIGRGSLIVSRHLKKSFQKKQSHR